MQHTVLPAWRKAPFLRLIIPFFTGILVQWYASFPVFIGWFLLLFSTITIIIPSFMVLSKQYFRRGWTGLGIHMMLFSAGFLLTYNKNSSHHPGWISNHYHEASAVLVTIEEPLSEKARSFKAIASVQALLINNHYHTVGEKIFLYFQKDSSLSSLHYGNQLIISKRLQPVKNTGNPGSFNYERFCAFQDVSYQVYLKPGEFSILKIKNENVFKKFLFTIRNDIVSLIRKYIPAKKEAGLAEAMLIGYKDDLDKDIVQSYSSAGIVHIIAISGMHLALIYWLLNILCKPLAKVRQRKWMRPVIILSGLWLFSILAGSSPSVLRSALMFSCLLAGESLARKISVFNSLAASAFLLLCYDPFLLWDAGFQLSYAAVLSIGIFYKPLYSLLSFKSRLLDPVCKLGAATLSAQILTAPLVIFHFHQFPNLFLLTNLVAVPLSGIILGGEILLYVVKLIPSAAKLTGSLLQYLIEWLNNFIEAINRIPGSSLNHLQLSIPQLICLYAAIAGMAFWLIRRKNAGLMVTLASLLVFVSSGTISVCQMKQQQKVIIYNIPQHQAIDYIRGSYYTFKGDSSVINNDHLQQLYLYPSRLMNRALTNDPSPGLLVNDHFFRLGNTTIFLADTTFHISRSIKTVIVDLIIISKNPAISIRDLTKALHSKKIIFDSSNPAWKIKRWKQECRQLGIACHSTSEEGAFVLSLH